MLKSRAHIMREAVRNKDFTFKLSSKGLFFGERAIQEALNDLGNDIQKLVAQNEVDSWRRLTRVLTHEIMNATTPIQSISQAYLSNPKIKGTAYEEGIQAIHDTSSSLASFVDSYRKFTQLQDPQPVDFDLENFVDSIISLYPALCWRKEIAPSSTIKADINLMRQVFINIAKNAAEAGAGNILVAFEDNTISISNDGEPIPADVRRDIFVPFFTTKSSGSGIGLALSRQILISQGITLSLAETARSGWHVTFEIVWC